MLLHEVGHSLGIGSAWFLSGVKTTYIDENSGLSLNYYSAANAVREYRNYANNQELIGIPIENDGELGIANVHPEEGDEGILSQNIRRIDGEVHPGLNAELMTGWMEDIDTLTPLSRITIGFLDDLGFQVDYSKADYFAISPEPEPEPRIPDYSGNFIYEVEGETSNPDLIEQPLYTLNNELIVKNKTYTVSGGFTEINVEYEFYDNNKYDGLHFYKNQNYTFGKNETINIKQFGNIPLCRYWPQYAEYNVPNYSGSHFENFKGRITATDKPTILNNTSFKWTFKGSTQENQNISHWDVSGIETFEDCFKNSGFNTNINAWNISNAINLTGVFYNAYNFNQPLDNWNTAKATYFSNMFKNASKFNQDIGNFNFSNCEINTGNNSMDGFLLNTSLTKDIYSNILVKWKDNIVNNNYTIPSHIVIKTNSYINTQGLESQNFFKNTYLWNFEDNGIS